MRKLARVLVLALVLAGAAVVVPGVAAASATEGYCGISWGSTPKVADDAGSGFVRSARAGRHQCFDRVVFDVDKDAGGFHVAYVDDVRLDGSGAVLPVPGGARLQVTLHNRAYDDAGNATYDNKKVDVAGYRTLRSVVYGNSFEGDTTFGVGVRARLPFRVFTLGNRVVLDVAHRWS
ncbi:AMIN-like domain-containing (lipo)protein [Pseudonocardia sp. TRM90224]|uniref:AMIN-like domain-containing (lipo)protein n=1 Tax=Pseudonocardia sp. TRM90224 TaxID=2812678 RepID=UPI001E59D5A7|nr:hypothetical protein [Pseudonocardia sp. TRM90224]